MTHSDHKALAERTSVRVTGEYCEQSFAGIRSNSPGDIVSDWSRGAYVI